MVWPFKKKLVFDALIEGCFHDDGHSSSYKVARLDIPENVQALDDKMYTYKLWGVTEDFLHICQLRKESGSERVAFLKEPLAFCRGNVLSQGIGIPHFPQVLERPRSIVLRDGRIFYDISLHDEEYAKILPQIVANARQAFEDKQAEKMFRY